jgi:hypothetical protein
MALQQPRCDQSVHLSEQQATAHSQRSIEANPCWGLVPQSHWANTQPHASYPSSVRQLQPDETVQRRGSLSQQPLPQQPVHEARRNQRHGALGGPTATAPFLKDFNLIAEAAKRAEMAVVMRDLEGVTL